MLFRLCVSACVCVSWFWRRPESRTRSPNSPNSSLTIRSRGRVGELCAAQRCSVLCTSPDGPMLVRTVYIRSTVCTYHAAYMYVGTYDLTQCVFRTLFMLADNSRLDCPVPLKAIWMLGQGRIESSRVTPRAALKEPRLFDRDRDCACAGDRA